MTVHPFAVYAPPRFTDKSTSAEHTNCGVHNRDSDCSEKWRRKTILCKPCVKTNRRVPNLDWQLSMDYNVMPYQVCTKKRDASFQKVVPPVAALDRTPHRLLDTERHLNGHALPNASCRYKMTFNRIMIHRKITAGTNISIGTRPGQQESIGICTTPQTYNCTVAVNACNVKRPIGC